MRTAFLVTAFIGLVWAGFGYTFWAVLHDRPDIRCILQGWALSFAYILIVSIGIPVLISHFDHHLGQEMLASWVPDPRGVIVIAFFGWFYPLIAAIAAQIVRRALQRWWPAAIARLNRATPPKAPPDA